ncbi:hypothetical protein CC86DRAFT_421269 [Ophiobolus disseminans]|uniref:Mannosyl-3-phosphoglycerate synthase n=1 Tax=Ophiobolus disseminans TaxID=1469910 RepID=A0A6A6ZTL4_9PLEO|nr:hypothetical protein CC86DRAFT_421269 [Ophiobolus disseminans]
MRLSTNSASAQIGNVKIQGLFRVIELDASDSAETKCLKTPNGTGTKKANDNTKVAFSCESLRAIESRTAIVIPCMNEEQDILDGVLRGVPHDCLIILVSNSDPLKFEAERELLTEFCNDAQRQGIVVHQQDECLAQAFHAAGMPDIVLDPSLSQESGMRIRSGKGEAMMISVAIAKLAGKDFIGFIDADNLVPSAVHEYCKVYAAGLHYALHHTDTAEAHAMVRIKWNSKPKVKDNKLVLEKYGRSSLLVNEWMNRFLDAVVDGDTQDALIQTGNAGEHAMSLDLAMELRFATRYAVEPFQLIDAWEQFGSPTPPTPSDARNVHILQIGTRSPHFHDTSKGDGHITRMQVEGLSTIYHSRLTPQTLKDELRAYMKATFPREVNADGEPEKMRVYPPMAKMNFEVLDAALKETGVLTVVGE